MGEDFRGIRPVRVTGEEKRYSLHLKPGADFRIAIYEGPWAMLYSDEEDGVEELLKRDFRIYRKIGNSIPLIGTAFVQLISDFVQVVLGGVGKLLEDNYPTYNSIREGALDCVKENGLELRNLQDGAEKLRQLVGSGRYDLKADLDFKQNCVQEYRAAIKKQRRVASLAGRFKNIFGYV